MGKIKDFLSAISEVLGYTKQIVTFFLWGLWLFATWFTVPLLWEIFPPLIVFPFIPVAYVVYREQARRMRMNRENRLKLINVDTEKVVDEYIELLRNRRVDDERRHKPSKE